MLLSELSTTKLAWTLGLTGAMFLGTLIVASVILVYMPADYFTRKRRTEDKSHPLMRWSLIIGKNLVGVLLVVLGVLMLVLPGQGVITIVIGVMLLDFPGKRKLVERFFKRPRIINSVNRFRARFGKSPLLLNKPA